MLIKKYKKKLRKIIQKFNNNFLTYLMIMTLINNKMKINNLNI